MHSQICILRTSQTPLQGACMFMRGNPKEFKHAWHEMVEKLGFHGNRWVTKFYMKYKR